VREIAGEGLHLKSWSSMRSRARRPAYRVGHIDGRDQPLLWWRKLGVGACAGFNRQCRHGNRRGRAPRRWQGSTSRVRGASLQSLAQLCLAPNLAFAGGFRSLATCGIEPAPGARPFLATDLAKQAKGLIIPRFLAGGVLAVTLAYPVDEARVPTPLGVACSVAGLATRGIEPR